MSSYKQYHKNYLKKFTRDFEKVQQTKKAEIRPVAQQKMTEIETHIHVYNALSKYFSSIRCGVQFTAGDYISPKRKTQKQRVIPDIVVYNDKGELLFAVEVKNSEGHKAEEQLKIYESALKVKCYLCKSINNLDSLIQELKTDGYIVE